MNKTVHRNFWLKDTFSALIFILPISLVVGFFIYAFSLEEIKTPNKLVDQNEVSTTVNIEKKTPTTMPTNIGITTTNTTKKMFDIVPNVAIEVPIKKLNTTLTNNNNNNLTTTLTNLPPMGKLLEVKFKNEHYEVYIVDLNTDNIELFLNDDNGKPLTNFKNLKAYIKQQGKTLSFATNGGMFHATKKPVGLYRAKSKNSFPKDFYALNKKNDTGNFFLQPNGVFAVTNDNRIILKETIAFEKVKNQTIYATQSGPMLVIDGKIHPKFNKSSKNTNIRSGVGYINSKTAVFILSKTPVTFYDFASLFKDEYKCNNALYLDGVISQMYYPTTSSSKNQDFAVMIGVSPKK